MKDIYTNFDVQETYIHYHVHDSQVYSANQAFTVLLSGTAELLFVTGSKYVHTSIFCSASDAGYASLYEGITATANGTTVSVYNMNRNSSNSCSSVCFHTPTWSTNTEKLLQYGIIGTGSANLLIGAMALRDAEWVLKPSTKYLVKIINHSAASIRANVLIQFYEKNI